MSSESSSGVPAPEDAAPSAQQPPLTQPPFATPEQSGQPYQGAGEPLYPQPTPPYQGVPPFQGVQGAPQYGSPQYGTAPHPQYGGPYPGYQVAPPPPARPNAALPIVVAVLAGLYVGLCLAEIFALIHHASLAQQVMAFPPSVAVDRVNVADRLVLGLSGVATVVFIALVGVLIAWQRTLRNALAPTGQYQQVLKASGYRLFRIVWLVSVVLAVVLRGGPGSVLTAQEAVSQDHKYLAYFAIRAALAGLLIFAVLRLKRASDNAYSAWLSQPAYGAGGPAYPQR